MAERSADLPQGIGPHEGREQELLLAGLKHVAYFGHHEPDWLSRFASQHCDAFGWVMWRQVWRDRTFYSHVLFRHGHGASAEELITLVSDLTPGWHPDRERRIGQILSYADEEIDAWIDWLGQKRR